jgi:hypothetical protein
MRIGVLRLLSESLDGKFGVDAASTGVSLSTAAGSRLSPVGSRSRSWVGMS